MRQSLILIIVILVLVMGGVVLKVFLSADEGANENSKYLSCQTDSDCVPKESCHPKTCINKEFAQDSSGSICTAVCEPESLDCGQGSCLCVNNKCNAVFNE